MLRSMNFVMTSPAVSKPTTKRVTTSTSHTAPSSSPASPLSSRSSPPHSQVVTHEPLISQVLQVPLHIAVLDDCLLRLLLLLLLVLLWLLLWLQVQDDVQRVTFSSFCLPFFPFLSFSPCHFSRLAHFLRGSCGCSPHLSTVSRRPQVRSIVDSDPPSILPPCHVSVRHVALFMH